MELGYELTIEQTQKLAMTPELIQAIKILQFNNQELNEYIENELMENPVLESEKTESTDIDIDELRDKILESNEELYSYKQWDVAAGDEEKDFSYEQYVAFRVSLTEHLLVQLQFSSLKGRDAAIGRYMIECIDDNGYLTMSVDEIAEVIGADSLGYRPVGCLGELAGGQGTCEACFSGRYPVQPPMTLTKYKFEIPLSKQEDS